MQRAPFNLKAGSPAFPAFFVFLFLLAANLRADTLVRWTFESGNVDQLYNATSPEGYAPEETAGSVIADRMRMAAPNAAESASKLRDKAFTIGGGGDTCLDAAGWTAGLDTGRYVEVRLGPTAGGALYLDWITLQHGGNGSPENAPKQLAAMVRIGAGDWQVLVEGLPVRYGDSQSPSDPADYLVSIFLGHPALQGVTEPVTVRFHAYGAGNTSNKWRIDNVTVEGTVSSPPAVSPNPTIDGVQIDPATVEIGGLYQDERMNAGEAIITRSMFADLGVSSQGGNINGASVVRLPDWLDPADRADPSAVYYLYFASHSGKYIRLAWAADIEGPWTLYRIGSSIPTGTRGVLDMGADERIEPGNGIVIRNHIASPDVQIDDVNEEFVLFFHGPTNLSGPSPSPSYIGSQSQRTFVATSSDGLDFNATIEPVSLGLFYFRVFVVNGRLHAFSNRGVMYRAPLGQDPFVPPAGFDFSKDYWELEPAPELLYAFQRGATGNVEEPRHVDYLYLPDGIRVFYTQVYGTPERMLAADIAFNGSDDWADWTIGQSEPYEILRPERPWEGAGNPDLGPSQNGAASDGENALRDPFLFADSGKLYLFYSGGGEDAIGLAELTELPAGFRFTGLADAGQGWWDLSLVNGLPTLTNVRAEVSTTGLDGPDFGPAAEQVLLDQGDGSYRLKVRVEGSPQRAFFRARGDTVQP